jgi:hypothetical protein
MCEMCTCFSVFPRSSGGKGPKSFGRWGSLKDRRHSSQGSLTMLSVPHRGNSRHSADSDSGTECVQTFQRSALYILGEKAQMKVTLALDTTLCHLCVKPITAVITNSTKQKSPTFYRTQKFITFLAHCRPVSPLN